MKIYITSSQSLINVFEKMLQVFSTTPKESWIGDPSRLVDRCWRLSFGKNYLVNISDFKNRITIEFLDTRTGDRTHFWMEDLEKIKTFLTNTLEHNIVIKLKSSNSSNITERMRLIKIVDLNQEG